MGGFAKHWTVEEDKLLKQFSGFKTASEIGLMLGRPKHGVYHRAYKLGVCLVKKGENHWAAKLSNTQLQMLLVLHEAGFSINEIHRAAFTHVSLQCLSDAVAARTRKEC